MPLVVLLVKNKIKQSIENALLTRNEKQTWDKLYHRNKKINALQKGSRGSGCLRKRCRTCVFITLMHAKKNTGVCFCLMVLVVGAGGDGGLLQDLG